MNFFLAALLWGLSSLISSAWAADPERLALVQDERIDECSGLAFSSLTDDAVWMHNDSGGQPRLFLVGQDGLTRSVCRIRSADAVDWEDMCSFRMDDQSYLLIGDVGDNHVQRTKKKSPCTLYLLREPKPSIKETRNVEWDVRFRFEYEDGPHNCEGIAVDVERREILLLTKELPFTCGLYRLPLDIHVREQNLTAKRIVRLQIPFATGLDISRDGRLLAAVTMWDGWICQRTAQQTWAEALKASIQRIRVPARMQGESVCFSADGTYLLLSSEQKKQPVWHVPVPKRRVRH